MKTELLKQRENLAESIRIKNQEIDEFRAEFEESIKPKIERLNKLITNIGDVESKLYELGVESW